MFSQLRLRRWSASAKPLLLAWYFSHLQATPSVKRPSRSAVCKPVRPATMTPMTSTPPKPLPKPFWCTGSPAGRGLEHVHKFVRAGRLSCDGMIIYLVLTQIKWPAWSLERESYWLQRQLRISWWASMMSVQPSPLTRVRKVSRFSTEVDCRESRCGASNRAASLTRRASEWTTFFKTRSRLFPQRSVENGSVSEREAGIPQELRCLISLLWCCI